MKLTISKSKNAEHFYVSKSVRINGKSTTKTVENLGTLEDIKNRCGDMDPYEWAKQYVKERTEQEKNFHESVTVQFSGQGKIEKGERQQANVGYLFLQDIYYELKLDKICEKISKKYKFTYDLNEILSRLIYTRILYPGSKKAAWEDSSKLLEQSSFELQHVYRGLEILCKESDMIQSKIYENSKKLFDRKNRILYYDCTNFYFEIEQEDKFRRFGYSKEHRPNPIVQMGLFMDADGIPLAFSMFPGNSNEQPSLIPLEKKLRDDFKLDEMVVCTDAGLASFENRFYNSRLGRSFITVQSIKQTKKHIQDFCLSPKGWHLPHDEQEYDLETIDLSKFDKNGKGLVFYKERWINEDGFEQRLIVSFSFEYQKYMHEIRNRQLERAQKVIDKGKKAPAPKANDYKRFLDTTYCTEDGVIANKQSTRIDEQKAIDEERFDGFYALCTNLEDDAYQIISVNKRRWEIEECFRIMKTEFKSRPVFLSREDRIRAHFITCFISLIIYRLLEKKLDCNFSCEEIIATLRDMNMQILPGYGFLPAYTRTDLTDLLHDTFKFHTDANIISQRNMGKIVTMTKK